MDIQERAWTINLAKDGYDYNDWEYQLKIHTFVLGAKWAISAAAAFPALFSSMKLIVEFINSRQIIPKKSCQSGPSPWNIISNKIIMNQNDAYWKLFQMEATKRELMNIEKQSINTRSLVHSLTPPLARTIAIIAAASITQDRGFHMKLRNFKSLFSCINNNGYPITH